MQDWNGIGSTTDYSLPTAIFFAFLLGGVVLKLFMMWCEADLKAFNPKRTTRDLRIRPAPRIVQPPPIVETPRTFTESDWEEICAAAVEKAKKGDNTARNWVEKNLRGGGGVALTQSKPVTDPQIVQDAVDCLCATGFKKQEAKKLVNSVSSLKIYTDVNNLIQDIFQKTNK